MASQNRAFQNRYDKLKAQGLSDDQALQQAGSQSEISPIEKIPMKDYQPMEKIKSKEGSYARAKKIVNKAIGRWRKVKKAPMLTQNRKYSMATESE